MIKLTDDIMVRLSSICSVEWNEDKRAVVTLENGKFFEAESGFYSRQIWSHFENEEEQ